MQHGNKIERLATKAGIYYVTKNTAIKMQCELI